MSKKSVVIALPPRVIEARTGEKREAESWISSSEAREQVLPSGGVPSQFGMIDLTAARSPLEFAWMIWTFPARATLHWMATIVGQPRR